MICSVCSTLILPWNSCWDNVSSLSSTHSASCHIILLGIGIHLCQATQSCINLTDKISLYSDDLQRGFSKHTQNAHYDILHCAMLCDAVRCCAFVPWERKTWEQVGENERYIHSCNSRWWRGECQLTCSFGWFLSGSTHCTFSLTQVQRVHVVDADETKIE